MHKKYLKATPLPPAPWPAGGREGSNLVTRCHTSITRRLSFKLSRRWPTAWLQTSAWRILQRCNCVHENLRAMEPLLGAVLGRSWGAPLQAAKLEDVHSNLGVLGERVGGLWVVLGASWGGLGGSWGDLGSLVAVLGRLGASLRRSWGVLGRSWGVLGSSWGRLGASWGGLGAVLGDLGAVLGRSWEVLRRSWVASCGCRRNLQNS